jgi:phosphopantothenoylcysteine decarboxylase/phosphopantothenate--cysteine ligase
MSEQTGGASRLCNRLLIGVTGSVAASSIPDFVVLLRRRSLVGRVDVMMTLAACRFIPPYRMRLSTGTWVFTDGFQTTDEVRVAHVQLTREADLFVIMPATANVIGKLAGGICDDLITTAAMASTCPLVVVPSMSSAMWEKPIVQRNIAVLRAAGIFIVQPAIGYEITDLQPSSGAMPSFEALIRELLAVTGHNRASPSSPTETSQPLVGAQEHAIHRRVGSE